jgi:hypothetical protein
MESIEVPDEGHVPSLESDLVADISRFVAACDATRAMKPAT